MEQIFTKADAYNWIRRLKNTLKKHSEAMRIGEVAFDKDGNDDVYFHQVEFPLIMGKFQEEIYKATNYEIWNEKAQSFQIHDLPHLCAYIINQNNVNMGLSLLECDQYCQQINRIMVRMNKESLEAIKDKQYRDSINEIDEMLFELRGNLILENPERKIEINNAYMGVFGESEESTNPSESLTVGNVTPTKKQNGKYDGLTSTKFTATNKVGFDMLSQLYEFANNDGWFDKNEISREDFIDLMGKADFRRFYDEEKKLRTKVRFIICQISNRSIYPKEWFAQACKLLELDAKQMGKHYGISKQWLRRWERTFPDPKDGCFEG